MGRLLLERASMRASIFCVPIASLKPLKLESRNFIYGFLIKQCTLIFSSPEPKAHKVSLWYTGRSGVRASVNIFKLEYLRNQWANRNEI